jgi:hypothetical protein
MGLTHFGILLTQGLKSIAALEKLDLTELQNDLGREIGVSVWTIYKWRDGTSIPNDDRTIGLLANACIRRGHMDRQWLVTFLNYTIHSNKHALINELCPGEYAEISVTHNLPRCQHVRLIGRENELKELKTFLSPRHRVGVICISGGGGVGKTALALEIAHECRKGTTKLPPEEQFAAIVWVTAKNVELLPAGQIERQPTFNDLEGVYRAIAELLDIPAVFRTSTRAEQTIIISRALTEHRILLVLDNLENIDDQELMIFLRDLPAPSKALVTTRHRIDVAAPVYLHMLNNDMAHELVLMECERHSLSLTEAQTDQLLKRTGGLPLAIIRTLGRMAWRGSSIETEIQQLNNTNNDIYDFCFSKTIALINPSNAYLMFLTLALFVDDVRREALGFVAGFGDDVFTRDEALSDLEVLSLCTKNSAHFGLEALTRTQALSELFANPVFATQARQRWVEWYVNYAREYGGPDEQELHLRYDYLEEEWGNILAAINWTVDHSDYDNAITLWRYVREFTHIYGYWTDRVRLLTWIILESHNRHDHQTMIDAMYDKAFTLSLTGPMGSLEEAESILEKCWLMRERISEVSRARIAALMASLCIRQKRYQEAHEWLDVGEGLLVDAQLDSSVLARERTSILYDRGENWFVMGNYVSAQQVFKEMLSEAQTSRWQRSVVHAQRWLAYTSILQGDLEAAAQYLQAGWPVANRIKDKRVGAYYKQTFAYYHHRLGNDGDALRWAIDALDDFERLGMISAAHDIKMLIDQWNAGNSIYAAVNVTVSKH